MRRSSRFGSLFASLTTLGALATHSIACGDDTGDGGAGGAPASTAATGASSSKTGSGSTASSSGAGTTTGTASASATATTVSTAEASSSASTGFPVCADYPVDLVPADVSATIAADLSTFAPAATLTYAPTRGTLQTITGLGIPLDCAAGDVWSAAWEVLNAHPTTFQLDENEWDGGVSFPCSAVTQLEIASTYRTTLAGADVAKDVFSLFLGPLPGGGVELRGVNGFYLPVLAEGDLTSCPDIDPAAIEPVLLQADFDFATFNQCVPTGSGTYVPQANDVLTFGDQAWEWDDGGGTVIARKLKTATLVIDPANVTPELQASDANCPDESGQGRVYGFVITFDPVTGEIFGVKPGVGCIVC